MKTEDALMPPAASAPGNEVVHPEVERAKTWLTNERDLGTLLGEETLWREAYGVYAGSLEGIPDEERSTTWACVAAELVFETGKVPLNQRKAAREACDFLVANAGMPLAEQARRLKKIADTHNVDAVRMRALLRPGIGYPWVLPRTCWTHESLVEGLVAMFAPFDWIRGQEPDAGWLNEHVTDIAVPEFLRRLRGSTPEGSNLQRILGAMATFLEALEKEGKDFGAIEPQTFVTALGYHGLSEGETREWHADLLALRDAVLLLASFRLYQRAEGLVSAAEKVRDEKPETALDLLGRAANLYKRLGVAQMYPERVLERQQQVWRAREELRADSGVPDERADHVLLVSTYESPGDLQRLVQSVAHELMGFGYRRPVHVVVSDNSEGASRERNEKIFKEAARAGMRVADWSPARRDAFLAELNAEVFPDGTFDVTDLAGMMKPGEKGIPYGRLRNFLRLAGLVELSDHGLEKPVFTWMDHDNELGALVLTRAGTLSKRHVFNYFDQKSGIFDDPKVKVGGGGYTNDALEGVEKFWVAWGILHGALALAQEHAPQGPAILEPRADITRFRPWDQPDTLERLPREGEAVETMADQFLLLLNTLVGTFRGKYDNQVQIYHPWTYGAVAPENEDVVEEMRAFAGMPGGNTSFGTDVLASPIPFITVAGRGEDIFHLWQLEGEYGPGSIFLTHTPAIHTRNVSAGRGDLMSEIMNSYNGRIFREPPYLWSALSGLSAGASTLPGPDVEEETSERIESLRAEAKASMAAVSGFAAAMETYVDEKSEFWWLAQAESDPRCAEVLGTLRGVVHEFKDVEKYHRMADEKLLGLEEVKDLTAQFLAAYPHWETVVEHVGGIRKSRRAGEGAMVAAGPREGYGSPLRAEETAAQSSAGRTVPEPAAPAEPIEEEPWLEVLTSSLLLFRRYERGRADQEAWLEWPERVSRLRSIYDHYAAAVPDLPPFVWTRLFRDALLIPHSAPYQALTDLLNDEAPAMDAGDRRAAVGRAAKKFEVDEELLDQAAGMESVG